MKIKWNLIFFWFQKFFFFGHFLQTPMTCIKGQILRDRMSKIFLKHQVIRNLSSIWKLKINCNGDVKCFTSHVKAPHHHHHHHLFLKRPSFHAQLGLDVPLETKPLHISLNTAHSGCKPSTFISSFTHSYQVFLPLPAHLTPATTTFLQADTQSSPFLRSTCPNHLNLPYLTTSSTLCTSRILYKSTQRFLSFSDTPHIHLTIIRFRLSPDFADSLSSSPRYQSHMSMTLWTQALYIFPLCSMMHLGASE